eukprot:COSAG01_NODE_7209_length_3304_cov_3.653978_2_plen_259_part_00
MPRPRSRLRHLAGHLDVRGEQEQLLQQEQESIRNYHQAGEARAMQLGNRGPLRFDADGCVSPEILESYYRHGFYVLEGVIGVAELRELRREVEQLLDNAPDGGGGAGRRQPWRSSLDRHGRPVRAPDAYAFAQPLSDPLGGSEFGVFDFKTGRRGKPRHPMRMRVPPSATGASCQPPPPVVQSIVHPLLHIDAALRLYGHPQLLAVAEALNGPDFTPFTESSFYKPAGQGTSTAWHQCDGRLPSPCLSCMTLAASSFA